MITKEIIDSKAESLISLVNSYKDKRFLIEIPLDQHKVFTNLNQFLVIYGINAQPQLDYLEINIRRKFMRNGLEIKAGSVIPAWKILKDNYTFLLDVDGKPLTKTIKKIAEKTEVTENIKEGDIISEVKHPITVNTINYLLFLFVSQKASLVDLLTAYALNEYIPRNNEFLITE